MLDWLLRSAARSGGEPGQKILTSGRAPKLIVVGTGSYSRERSPRRGTREVLLAYSESPWVQAIVDRIASGVATTQWKMMRAKRTPAARALASASTVVERRAMAARMRKADELEEIEESNPMIELLSRGSDWFSGPETIKLWQTYVELAGEGFGVMDISPKGPTSIWPIPPHWMYQRPSGPSSTDRFIMYPDAQMGRQQELPIEAVLWFRHADPFSPFGPGIGRAQSLGDEIDTDDYAAKTAKHAFLNGARPDLIMIPEEPVDEDELTKMLGGWNQKLRGIFNQNKVHALTQKFTVVQMTPNFEHLQFIELRQAHRDMMVHVWGIPPEILGILENSNRSTIDAADFLFQSKVILPRVEYMRRYLQTHMLPLFAGSEAWVLDFESPVGEDREFKAKVYQQSAWAFTVDEHRALAGDPPLEGKRGEVFVSPFGLVPSDTPAGAGAAELEAMQNPPEPEPAEDQGDPEPEPEEEGKALEIAVKSPLEDVLRAVNGKGMLESLEPVLRETVKAFGAAELEKIGIGVEFNVAHPKVQEFLRNRAAEQVQRITETTRKKLRAAITTSNEAGGGINEISSSISQVFSAARGNRALVIAQTESARAANFGVLEGMQQGGVDEKEWLSTRDDRVRETHDVMDGQRVAIEANFTSPSGAAGPYPGNLGRAEEDIQCRCTTLSVIQGETSVGAMETKRTAAWRAHEARRRPYQRLAVRALRQAFTEQERAALAALRA